VPGALKEWLIATDLMVGDAFVGRASE